MKNQYFGDINDYRKYGILRILSGNQEIRTGICWMLTLSDGRTDGKFLEYLQAPEQWKHYDPQLYETLHNIVELEGKRDVKFIENSGMLPAAKFYTNLLTDNINERLRYFHNLYNEFNDIDLLFFDPDNGFEVKSTPLGRKNSSKYLYWEEFIKTYSEGFSVLVYQHFTREAREGFINRIINKIKKHAKIAVVYSLRTPYVVFFLAPQKKHVDYFDNKLRVLSHIWKNQITVLKY